MEKNQSINNFSRGKKTTNKERLGGGGVGEQQGRAEWLKLLLSLTMKNCAFLGSKQAEYSCTSDFSVHHYLATLWGKTQPVTVNIRRIKATGTMALYCTLLHQQLLSKHEKIFSYVTSHSVTGTMALYCTLLHQQLLSKHEKIFSYVTSHSVAWTMALCCTLLDQKLLGKHEKIFI